MFKAGVSDDQSPNEKLSVNRQSTTHKKYKS